MPAFRGRLASSRVGPRALIRARVAVATVALGAERTENWRVREKVENPGGPGIKVGRRLVGALVMFSIPPTFLPAIRFSL